MSSNRFIVILLAIAGSATTVAGAITGLLGSFGYQTWVPYVLAVAGVLAVLASIAVQVITTPNKVQGDVRFLVWVNLALTLLLAAAGQLTSYVDPIGGAKQAGALFTLLGAINGVLTLFIHLTEPTVQSALAAPDPVHG